MNSSAAACAFLTLCLSAVPSNATASDGGDTPQAKSHGVEPFVLTRGHGVRVCEAYLLRLNTSKFEVAPYCGCPERADIEGFAFLNRVPLNTAEVQALLDRVADFTDSGDQDRKQTENQSRRSRGFEELGPRLDLKTAEVYVSSSWIKAWRYDPPVDIDNDGIRDPVMVWHGYGASYGAYRCGSTKHVTPQRQAQITYVMDLSSNRIDALRTRELFGHPAGGYPQEEDGKQVGLFKPFRPIGRAMGVFNYEGTYYFDTFFDSWGDFEGRRREDKSLPNTLGVFLRKNASTHQVCEFQWRDPHGIE